MTRAERIEEAARALLDKWFEAEPRAEIEAMRAALALPVTDQDLLDVMEAARDEYDRRAGFVPVAMEMVPVEPHPDAARLAAALDVLREVEWNGSPDGDKCCPECMADGNSEPEDRNVHEPDCKLAAVLAGAGLRDDDSPDPAARSAALPCVRCGHVGIHRHAWRDEVWCDECGARQPGFPSEK